MNGEVSAPVAACSHCPSGGLVDVSGEYVTEYRRYGALGRPFYWRYTG